MSTHNRESNNYTQLTTDKHNGTQKERSFDDRANRQLYLRTRGREHPPKISRQVRTVERTGSDSD